MEADKSAYDLREIILREELMWCIHHKPSQEQYRRITYYLFRKLLADDIFHRHCFGSMNNFQGVLENNTRFTPVCCYLGSDAINEAYGGVSLDVPSLPDSH